MTINMVTYYAALQVTASALIDLKRNHAG